MPLGPSKYDDLCTYVREKAEAQGVVVIVMRGNKGDGFAMQASYIATLDTPRMLHNLADQVQESIPALKQQMEEQLKQEAEDARNAIERTDAGSGEGTGGPGGHQEGSG